MTISLNKLWQQVETYLMEYDVLRQRWARILEQRRSLLALPNPKELMALCEEEKIVASALRELIARRTDLLEQGKQIGFQADTLRELAKWIVPEAKEAGDRMGELQFHADQLRRESWSQWVTCQKSLLYYGQLVQLIANGGRKSSAYGSGHQTVTGGAILDASV